MSEIVAPIVYQLGVGGVAGFVAGYTVKKITKLILIVIGFFVMVLIYLGYTGIINVNYNKLAEAVSGLVGKAGGASSLLVAIVAHLPFAGSFIVAFLIGWKMG